MAADDFWFAQLDEIVRDRSDQRSFHLFAEGQHSDVRAQIFNLLPGAHLELPQCRSLEALAVGCGS